MKAFDIGPVTDRSMPFWCVANPLGDPFGDPVLKPLSPLSVCDILCWAAKQGLIERTGFHDDDLVQWDPAKPDDDLDEKSETFAILQRIKGKLDEASLRVNTATCNLHGNPIFRKGGLANPDAGIRDLAHLKVQRTLRIGHLLGAEYVVYWVARDGFEVPIQVPWKDVYTWIAEGLNDAREYIASQGFNNYIMGSLEPKPNEPRGHMFLPTAGHAVGFIETMLNDPSFWGVNPELIQHEGMTLLDPLTCLSFLLATDKLAFLHFGNQIKGQFDNDFPPLVGPEHLKETALMFWLLENQDWKGVVEFDCHMLRSEGNPDDPIGCRKGFIKNCGVGLTTALTLASRIKASPVGSVSESEADLQSTIKMCDLDQSEITRVTWKR